MSQAGILNVSGGGGSGSPVQTITGNSGGAVPPTANNINLVGSGSITVTGNPGTSTLTITDSGGGLVWNDRAISFAASSNNGYFVSASATGTMPASPAQGDEVEFCITNAGVTMTIVANAGQRLCVGTDLSAIAGNTVATNLGSSISFTYQASSSTWFSVTSPQGTFITT